MPPGGRLWILELFWDRQRFEAAAFSLQQTSLYFSCVANGNSQMYDSKVFLALLPRAGLAVTRLSDGVGRFHTLVECSAAEPKCMSREGAGVAHRRRRAMSRAPARATALVLGGRLDRHPAYNEERTIRGLAEAALTLCPRVLVVDDGSTDATAAQLRRPAADLAAPFAQPGQGGEPAHRVSAMRWRSARPASSPSTATASTTRATRRNCSPSGASGPTAW